jgi:mono/diheme cytochrome c family protein
VVEFEQHCSSLVGAGFSRSRAPRGARARQGEASIKGATSSATCRFAARDRLKPAPTIKLALIILIASNLAACQKPTSGADERHGRELFQSHCAPCHETPPPDLLKQPPKLNGLFKSKTMPSGAPATDAQVRTVIVEGLRTMPAFQGRLKDSEISDLIAYLHQFR